MKWELAWDLVYIATGAVIGALIRYRVTGEGFVLSGLPVSVLIINLVGSLILGMTATAATRFGMDPRLTLFVGIGFCGSLTTMSTFAFETASLMDAGRLLLAAADILLNVAGSLAAIFLGRALVVLLLGGSG